MKRRCEAFSLVEILIVVFIVGLLVALSLPVYNQAMARAGAAKCTGNLRQIGSGLLLYASDSGGFPPYVNSVTRWVDGSDDPGSFFAGPYLGARARDPGIAPQKASPIKGIFDCPTLTNTNAAWNGFDYAYNITLTGRRGPALSSPSRTVLVTEGGNAARVKAEKSSSPMYFLSGGSSNPGGTAWNYTPNPIIYPHNGRANFLFVDGHVGSFQQSDLTEAWFDGNWPK